MMSKMMKIWHSWFSGAAEPPESPSGAQQEASAPKPPSPIVVRTAMRQKQKSLKASS